MAGAGQGAIEAVQLVHHLDHGAHVRGAVLDGTIGVAVQQLEVTLLVELGDGVVLIDGEIVLIPASSQLRGLASNRLRPVL